MKRIGLVLVMAQAINLGSCQIKTPGDQEIVIPMDLSSRRPVVELNLNGVGPYQFIFDTGSGTHVIDKDLADQMNLETTGADTLRTPGSDNILLSPRVEVSEVSFPANSFSANATMNTMELRKMLPVDGILSPILFSDYLISLDYPGEALIVTSGELDEDDSKVIPFVQKPRAINVEVDVDGTSVEAHLDSGNPGGFNLPYSLKDELEFKDGLIEDGWLSTPVARFKKWRGVLSGEINVGGVVFRDPEVRLVEGFEFVNLGYEVMKDLKVSIDRKNTLILFERSALKKPSVAEGDIDTGETNDYTGWYGGKVRRVFIEDGEMYLQRTGSSKLKLVELEKDLYEMVFHTAVMNELPNVRFERDEDGEVSGLTFVYENGKEEFVGKD